MESKTYMLRWTQLFDGGFTIREITDEGDPEEVKYENLFSSTLKTDSRRGTLKRTLVESMLGRGFARIVQLRKRR